MLTEGSKEFFDANPEHYKHSLANIPLGRLGDPEKDAGRARRVPRLRGRALPHGRDLQHRRRPRPASLTDRGPVTDDELVRRDPAARGPPRDPPAAGRLRAAPGCRRLRGLRGALRRGRRGRPRSPWHRARVGAAIKELIEANSGPAGSAYRIISNPHVVVDGDRATSTAMFTVLVPHDGVVAVAALGHHFDELRREDGRWRFARRRAEVGLPSRPSD